MIPYNEKDCPHCNKNFAYFTVNSFIECPHCGMSVDVEPMQELPDEPETPAEVIQEEPVAPEGEGGVDATSTV